MKKLYLYPIIILSLIILSLAYKTHTARIIQVKEGIIQEKSESHLNDIFQTKPKEKQRVIIVFKKQPSETDLEKLDIIHRYESMSVVSAYVSKRDLIKLKDLPNIDNIIIDRKTASFRSSSLPVIRSPEANALGYNGTDVIISVIDTGVYNHTEFQNPNRLLSNQKCYCFPNCCPPNNVAESSNATDDQSHGTSVAGISSGLKGVANGTSILPVKVLDSSGSGYDSDVAKGIEWAFLNNANIIQLSLGGCVDSSNVNCYDDCYDSLSSRMVENAAGNNTLVIAAAGNCGPTPSANCKESGNYTISWPACTKSAVTVGATNDDDEIAGFSSRGPTDNDNRTKPDLVAPGVSIESTTNSLNGYTTGSGTSFSSPHVSGVAALVIQAFNRTFGYYPEQARVKAILLSATNTTKMETEGMDQRNNYYGAGRIDAYEAVSIINYTVNDTISQGQTHVYNLNVTGDARVSLYWPEDQNTNNDLDLLVDNSTHNFSFPANSADNVEQIFLYSPMRSVFLYSSVQSIWKIYVKSSSGSSQQYYLASNMEISGDTTPPFIEIILPENKTYNNHTLTLNFTTDSTNHTSWYTINGENETVVIGNTTFNVSSDGSYYLTLFVNDSFNNINQTTRYFSVDTASPRMNVISPQVNQIFSNTSIWFNASIDEGGDMGLFSVDNSGNVTMTKLNSTYFYNQTSISEGNHNVTFYINDTAGWTNLTTVNFSVMILPIISDPNIDKPVIIQNETVNITGTIQEENLFLAWVNFSKPDDTSLIQNMTNSSTTFYLEFNDTNTTGTYDLILFVNDTFSNEANTTLQFEVSEPTNITFNISDGIIATNISFKILYNNTGKIRASSTDSDMSFTIPQGIWDIQLNTSETNVTIRKVNFTEDVLREVVINESILPIIPNVNVRKAVAVQLINFSFVDANLTFLFNQSLIVNVNNLRVYKCGYWNFSSGECNVSWTEDSADVSFNATIHLNNVTIATSSFSAFSLGEVQSYCGDGSCSGGETCSSCSQDCGSCSSDGSSSGGGAVPVGVSTVETLIETSIVKTTTTEFQLVTPNITCGNNVCESSETCSSCPQDCECPEEVGCEDEICIGGVELTKPRGVKLLFLFVGFVFLMVFFVWKIVRQGSRS